MKPDITNMRLEIEDLDSPDNLVKNATAQHYGTWGWFQEPRPSTVTPVTQTFDRNNGADGNGFMLAVVNRVWTEPFRVVPNQWVRASIDVNLPLDYSNSSTTYIRVGHQFMNSAGSVVSTHWSNWFQQTTAGGSITRLQTTPSQAPATAVRVRLVVSRGVNNNSGSPDPTGPSIIEWTSQGGTVKFTKAELLIRDTNSFPTTFVPSITWRNIVTNATSINVTRREMEVGTMNAIVRDATVDPAQAAGIRPGKRVRVTALVPAGSNPSIGSWPDTWEPIFTGTLSRAETKYEVDGSVTVTLGAVDAFGLLTSTPAQGVPGRIVEADNVLAPTGAPYNDSSGAMQFFAETDVALYRYQEERLTALDALGLLRDTNKGYLMVDRTGVIRIGSGGYPDTLVWTFDDTYQETTVREFRTSFSHLDIGYDTSDLVNVINLKTIETVKVSEHVQFTDSSGQVQEFTALVPKTVEQTYQFTDDASIAEWGARAWDVTTLTPAVTSHQANPDGTVTVLARAYEVSDWAAAILAAKNKPVVKARTMQFPVKSPNSRWAATTIDLFGQVKTTRGTFTSTSKVRGIQHTIRPGKWTVTYDFQRPSDGILW